MEKLDDDTVMSLLKMGVTPHTLKELPFKPRPGNLAGLPGLIAYKAPELAGTNIGGFMLANRDDLDSNRGRAQAVFLNPHTDKETLYHEVEHLLARQQLGHPRKINSKFDELTNNTLYGDKRLQFIENAIAAAPYLKEKYGLNSAYFDREYVKKQPLGLLLYEHLADLAAIESAQSVDLTKDPVLRKTLFKDREIRETYNAITGLRQTRLDPRDLPPYTRQPEEPGMIDKIKKLFSKAEGGSIHQREPKYI